MGNNSHTQSLFASPSQDGQVSAFLIPPMTPRTQTSSKQAETPKKQRPADSMLKDLNLRMESLDTSMGSPPKGAHARRK